MCCYFFECAFVCAVHVLRVSCCAESICCICGIDMVCSCALLHVVVVCCISQSLEKVVRVFWLVAWCEKCVSIVHICWCV